MYAYNRNRIKYKLPANNLKMLVQNYVSEGKKITSTLKPFTSKQTSIDTQQNNDKSDGHGTPQVKNNEKLLKTKYANNRTLEDCQPVIYSNLEQLPYMEYIENDECMLNDLDGSNGEGKVRRQISD